MKSDISFGGEMRPQIIRGPAHKGWRRMFVLIRDWLRLGR